MLKMKHYQIVCFFEDLSDALNFFNCNKIKEKPLCHFLLSV